MGKQTVSGGQGIQTTNADFGGQIANAERLSQTLLDVDIRFQAIADTLSKMSKEMDKAFDSKAIKKSVDLLDGFLKKAKQIERLSDKLELVLYLKGQDQIDKVYKQIKDTQTEAKKLQTVFDNIGPGKFTDLLESIDISSLPKATQEALKNIELQAPPLDFSAWSPRQVLPAIEPFGETIKDFFYNLDIELKPPIFVGNDFVDETLKKQKEASKKLDQYKEFHKASTGAQREQAYAGLSDEDKGTFNKARMELVKERDAENAERYKKDQDKAGKKYAKSKKQGWRKTFFGSGGDEGGEEDGDGGKSSSGNKKGGIWDVLNKVYIPKIPGMSNKSVGGVMGAPGGAAAFGIQAVVEILQKIFQIISEASGFMKAIMKMINITIQMFFRPIGDMLGRFLMPYIRIMMVRTAQNYAKWAQGGFKPEEFGGLMADNALVMFEGLGAIIFDSLVKANFMILRGLVTLGVMIDKGIVWIVTEAVKNIIIQLITVAQYLSTGILGGLKWIVDAVFTIGRQIVITAFDVLRSLISAIFTVVKSAVYPIIAAFDKLINVVNGQGKDPNMRGSFVTELNKVEAGLTSGIGAVESGIINGMNAIQAPIDKWFNDTIKNINTTANNWIKALNTAVDNLRKTLYDRLDQSAKEMNALLDKVEKAVPSALEWYEKQTAPVFTSTMKASADTAINTKQNVAATAAVTAKVGTGTEQAVAFNKKLADANKALGSGGSISSTITGTSKAVAETIKAADAKAVITGKTLASAIGSLKVTSQADSSDTYNNTSTKTIAANGDMTLQDAMSINRVGHTYAYFHSAEYAGLAGGGYVTKPTTALIGEGKDPRELVLPMETGARVMAKEITNILGNNRGDSRPSINIHMEFNAPIYGVPELEREIEKTMKKEMAKWSWR